MSNNIIEKCENNMNKKCEKLNQKDDYASDIKNELTQNSTMSVPCKLNLLN